jgi:ankyrin repeat protein
MNKLTNITVLSEIIKSFNPTNDTNGLKIIISLFSYSNDDLLKLICLTDDANIKKILIDNYCLNYPNSNNIDTNDKINNDNNIIYYIDIIKICTSKLNNHMENLVKNNKYSYVIDCLNKNKCINQILELHKTIFSQNTPLDLLNIDIYKYIADNIDTLKYDDIVLNTYVKANTIDTNFIIKNINTLGQAQPLIYAVHENNLELVKFFVEKCGADVEQKWPSNESRPLMFAAENGNIEMMRYLLSLNAYICALNKAGKDALYYAVIYNKISAVELLISKGTNVNILYNDTTPLSTAIDNINIEIIKMLLDAGANTNDTIIEYAYKTRNENVILCLLKHNIKLCNAETLKYAIDHKMKNLFNFLIDNNIKNDTITLDILTMMYKMQ